MTMRHHFKQYQNFWTKKKGPTADRPSPLLAPILLGFHSWLIATHRFWQIQLSVAVKGVAWKFMVSPLGIHRILRQKVRLLTSLMCSIFLHLGSRPTPCSPISSVPGRTPRWCKNWTITCIIHQWHVLPKCLGISKFKNNIYVWFLCLTLEKNLEIEFTASEHVQRLFFLMLKNNEQNDPCFRGKKSNSCCSASGTPMLRTSSSKNAVSVSWCLSPDPHEKPPPPQHGLLHLVQSWIASPGKEIAVVTKASPIFCLCLWQVADILGKFSDEVPLFSSHPCRKWRNECVAQHSHFVWNVLDSPKSDFNAQ